MWFKFPKRKPSLNSTLHGRELTAFYLDDDARTACLRFSDNSAVAINLDSRECESIKAKGHIWLTLPGWVRIANVIEDAGQVILVISGAIHTARISFRFSQQRWQIFFSNGRIF